MFNIVKFCYFGYLKQFDIVDNNWWKDKFKGVGFEF